MNILITGVGPHNKGAELMLVAILDQLRQRLPAARAVLSPDRSSFSWRSQYGLYQLFDSTKSGRLGWFRKLLIHEGYRDRFGMVLPEDIDVVLDSSGYAYGDVWKPEWVETTATQLSHYKKFGAKIILLPQAFGPFANERIRFATKKILTISDMVFARDSDSFTHCVDISECREVLHQAPDFTNLVNGHLPGDWVVENKHVAIIPNEKMLTHTEPNVASRYLPTICRVIERLCAAEYHPFILVHESQDKELASRISYSVDAHCPVIIYHEPLAIKGIVRYCAFVLSSRYHGLVNSLSQGVPAIAIGWSHKYTALLRDYDFAEGLWSLEGREGLAQTPLSTMLNESRRREIASHLEVRSRGIKKRVKQMWEDVERCINPHQDGDSRHGI